MLVALKAMVIIMKITLKKILALLIVCVLAFQSFPLSAFAGEVKSNDSETQLSNNVLLNSAVENGIVPTEKGVWINNDSKKIFVDLLNSVANQNYFIDENGYLSFSKTSDSDNSYDKKIGKLINGKKTVVVSISDTYGAYNSVKEEAYSVMLEDDESALIFHPNGKTDVVVLNYYHYALHCNENNSNVNYTNEELINNFFSVFDSDSSAVITDKVSSSIALYSARAASRARIPSVTLYKNFTYGTYGKSGNLRNLNWYKIGNGPNVVIAVFAQHGWEDAWSADGAELVKIADDVMSSLSSMNQNIFNDWTVYVIPYANPDGIADGYTNNGPGRCTVTTKVDMNRCWPADFKAVTSSGRNYTGSSPLGAPEAVALKDFISENIGNYTNVVLDVHGWLDKSYGDTKVGSYFDKEFGFSHKASYGSGYLQNWAYHQKNTRASLIEFPEPNSSSDIIKYNYAGKFTNALVNMMNGLTSERPIEVGSISNVKVSNVSGVSATISWSAASNATGYVVETLSSPTGNWEKAVTTSSRSYTLTNLQLAHNYSVRITPFRKTSTGVISYGSTSHSFGFTTLNRENALKNMSSVGALRLANITDTSFDVSFNAINDANAYFIQYSVDNKTWNTAASTTKTNVTISNLKKDTYYYVRVVSGVKDGDEYYSSDKYSNIYKCLTKANNVSLSDLKYTDLNGYDYYADYVAYTSVYNTYINGTNPPEFTKFSPKTSLTRAMIVTILYNMAGRPYDNGNNPHKTNPFTDANENAYYYLPACWALDNGITNQTTFLPNKDVPREQTVSFLFRYATHIGAVTDEDYKNVSLSTYGDYETVSEWATESMQWAVYEGIINGTTQGNIDPSNITQRIHASKILYVFGKSCNIGNFK